MSRERTVEVGIGLSSALILLGAGLLIAATSSSRGQRPVSAPTARFRYAVTNSWAVLDSLGRLGYELVAVGPQGTLFLKRTLGMGEP